MKKNRMKLLGIVLLVITAVSVVLTFLIVAKLSHPTGESSEAETVVELSASGIVENAYVVSSKKDEMIVLYKGKRYVANQTAASDYTGVEKSYIFMQSLQSFPESSTVIPITPFRLRDMSLFPAWTTFRYM